MCTGLQATGDYMKVMQLVNAYQTRGHSVATLDPLGMYVEAYALLC